MSFSNKSEFDFCPLGATAVTMFQQGTTILVTGFVDIVGDLYKINHPYIKQPDFKYDMRRH